MQLADTHCHIHSADYPIPMTDVDAHCVEASVTRLICVGTDADDSERAVRFVQDRADNWAAIGLHPHVAKSGQEQLVRLRTLLESERISTALPQHPTFSLKFVLGNTLRANLGAAPRQATRHQGQSGSTEEGASERKIVAIGECGLDYFYNHSSKADQERALRYQIELALEYNLPLIFHVRDAFDDFWPIFDSYNGLRGELHSFTDNLTNLNKAISRGLYVGVNGIVTFAKNNQQLEVAKQIPADKILLETDSPFLTPVPLRGTVNEPARVRLVASFLANLRQESLEIIAAYTTTNARQLFSI